MLGSKLHWWHVLLLDMVLGACCYQRRRIHELLLWSFCHQYLLFVLMSLSQYLMGIRKLGLRIHWLDKPLIVFFLDVGGLICRLLQIHGLPQQFLSHQYLIFVLMSSSHQPITMLGSKLHWRYVLLLDMLLGAYCYHCWQIHKLLLWSFCHQYLFFVLMP